MYVELKLVLHVTYIFFEFNILFSINLKVTSFRVSFAVGYIKVFLTMSRILP